MGSNFISAGSQVARRQRFRLSNGISLTFSFVRIDTPVKPKCLRRPEDIARQILALALPGETRNGEIVTARAGA